MLLLAVLVAAAPRLGVVVDTNLDEAHALVRAVAAQKYAVVPAAEMKQHIAAAASLGIACPKAADAECVARVGAFAKLPFVLLIAGSNTSATVTLVDTASSVRKGTTQPLGPDAATHKDTLRALLEHVLRGAPLTSSIRIEVAPGVKIDVDGTPRGEGAQHVEVPPGRHVVRAGSPSSPAHTTATPTQATREVETFAGVTSVLRLDVGAATGDPALHAGGESSANAPGESGESGSGESGESGESGRLRPLVLGGFVVAGASALVATGTLVGAVLVTPDPDNRSDYSAREFNDATSTGQTLGIVAAVAGAATLLGGVLGVAGLAFE